MCLRPCIEKKLPQPVLKSIDALIGCIAGAIMVDQTIDMIQKAGLKNIEVKEKAYNIDIMTDCNDPLYKQIQEFLPDGVKLSDYIVSVDITAFK